MLHYNFPSLSVANFANPVCLGCEVKQSLLTKYTCYAQHLLSVLLHFPPVWSQVQVCLDKTSSGCSPHLRYTVRIGSRMPKTSLPTVFIKSYFRVVLNSRPPPLEKIVYGWMTTIFIELSLVAEQPIGASLLSSHRGQTSCSSHVDFVTGSCDKKHTGRGLSVSLLYSWVLECCGLFDLDMLIYLIPDVDLCTKT